MINVRIQPEIAKTEPAPSTTPRIAVIGVGGAGGNAVNNMIESNLQGVEFIVCNTDAQALENSKAAKKIQLGTTSTSGLGAGSRPEVGREAAEENINDVIDQLDGANMVFITAGMGGGTGTGAAPVIAKAARDRGILTVGVVTKPFHFEGAHRMRSAESGLKDMEEVVDTLIVIPNQNLFRIANEKTTFAEAFRMADGVLQSGVRGVTDLMVMPGLINLDFNDIRNVMEEMGKAMMGTGEAEGEGRAIKAAEAAINNPLLDDVSMKGARGVIINITGGYDMTLFEVDEACNHIRDQVDPDANIIFGSTFDERIKGSMRVSVVATGIDQPAVARQRSSTTNAPVAARASQTVAEGGANTAAPFGYSPATTAAAPMYQPQQPTAPVYAAPQAYSPTIKAPAAAFTIPSAPAVIEQPVPAPVQYAPELPLAPNATAGRDYFVAPVPVMPERAPVIQHELPVAPPQAYAAPMAPVEAPIAPAPVAARPVNAPRLPSVEVDEFDDAPRNRAPSIFDRLRNLRGAHPAPAAPQASAPVQRAAPTMRRSPAALQPTLDIEARPLATQQVAAEDDLDIPAFLRRQAN